ncbi:MAG: hypothetical protein GWN67_03565, partial [Phycisphaerae bacterium]|nr:hypothetical protein [Phycisphaerae bacterium]NIS50225.1 hypothetical protein [Phycisphaerae bacterium]NIU07889.1 hypothetical protein [Phycisphaerae bacterium]NIU55491.1 hypothetical protein [Phycisphaerae bacterium]NIU99860.1 hypothetical protein [Phycisphaerae bacterium]
VVYVDNGGYVGIGTTNPLSKLSVVGAGYFRDNVGIGTSTPEAKLSIQMRGQPNPTIPSLVAPGLVIKNGSWNFGNQLEVQDSSGNTRFLVDSAGNVGIGVTSPTEKLEVAGNEKVTGDLKVDGSYFDSSSDAGTAGQILSSTGAGTNWTNLPSGGDSDWTISGSDMYSAVSGNVGIGTTSPSAKLTVDGAILREGSMMWGSNAHTHINLGTASDTGTDSFNYSYATVSGGNVNTAGATYATVGGGELNTSFAEYATVSGGRKNNASGLYATVAGGWENTANGEYGATVAGGRDNTSSGFYSAVGGGWENTASNDYDTVGGGNSNTASGYWSTVSGGSGNTASGNFGTIAGGRDNTASGHYSFAAGRRAKAIHNGTFVWADSTDADFQSTGTNQFLILANGGVGIGTSNPAGYTLAVSGSAAKPGGGSWSLYSDRRLKKNIEPLSGALDRMLQLEGVSFEYSDPEHFSYVEGEQMGMIAQEVENVFPDWVSENDGYKAVTFRGFEALTVESLRELRQEKDAEIARLKEENEN